MGIGFRLSSCAPSLAITHLISDSLTHTSWKVKHNDSILLKEKVSFYSQNVNIVKKKTYLAEEFLNVLRMEEQ